MRKYGKWLLVLGVMAVCPAFADAEGFLGQRKPALPFGAASQQTRNQAMAEQVASALRDARLNGYDVQIEVRNGVAVIDGKVREASHRALATQVASSVPGIERVENNLSYVPAGAIQQASATAGQGSSVTNAAYEPSSFAGGQIQRVSGSGAGASSNQQVAEQIAASLSQAGLVGYDIEIRYSNGVATLAGNVGTSQQRQAASDAVSRIPGIQSVNNQLQVNAAVSPTSYAPNMMPMMHSASMSGGMSPSPMGVAPASFNNPHLPAHAWPAYAQYPNSAAVTYPTQYSASAWPYIGPFYPYPQVPMGWREVSLEWDDGHWQLNFNKEKDKWYWILSPKNW